MPNFNFPEPFDPIRIQKMLATHPAFSNPLVSLTVATITLTEEAHSGRTMVFNRAAGVTVTLPAAIGNGAIYRFVIGTVATTNSLIVKVANTTDVFQGFCHTAQDSGDTAVLFETAADSDTITLNRSTMGSTQKGEFIDIQDIAAGIFSVRMTVAATGTEASPFSAGV